MTARTFYFHYNKPASLKAKKPKLSIHFRDTCYIVDHVVCEVPIRSRHKKTQPRCVMTGKATHLKITTDSKLGVDIGTLN